MVGKNTVRISKESQVFIKKNDIKFNSADNLNRKNYLIHTIRAHRILYKHHEFFGGNALSTEIYFQLIIDKIISILLHNFLSFSIT